MDHPKVPYVLKRSSSSAMYSYIEKVVKDSSPILASLRRDKRTTG
jgi:hypothetical protein